MSELAVTVLRLSYLVLLWFFVLSAIAVLRSDVYGTRIRQRRSRQAASAAAGAGAPASAGAAKASKRQTGFPTQLVVTGGPLTGATLPLSNSPILIGRSPACTLVLDDDFSSNRHARLFPESDGWYVEDLGSTNGTFLGTTRVEQPLRVPAGAPIHIGQTVLELRR